MLHKNTVRQEIKNKLSKLTEVSYEQLSQKIADRLFQDEDWQEATMIGITISNAPEVNTFEIIKKAWEEGKQIVVPKCYSKGKMVFRKLTSFDQLESVFYGLLEPIEAETESVTHDDIDLLIVPGLAYSLGGYRLGFGGGYYDRYLEDYKGKTLSLAFQLQIISELPIESHDLAVSKIITENETIITNA